MLKIVQLCFTDIQYSKRTTLPNRRKTAPTLTFNIVPQYDDDAKHPVASQAICPWEEVVLKWCWYKREHGHFNFFKHSYLLFAKPYNTFPSFYSQNSTLCKYVTLLTTYTAFLLYNIHNVVAVNSNYLNSSITKTDMTPKSESNIESMVYSAIETALSTNQLLVSHSWNCLIDSQSQS